MSQSSLKDLIDLFSVGTISNSLSSWRSLHGALQDQHHEMCWSARPGGQSPMGDNMSNGPLKPPCPLLSHQELQLCQTCCSVCAHCIRREQIANHGQKSHRCHKWPSLKKHYYYQHPLFHPCGHPEIW